MIHGGQIGQHLIVFAGFDLFDPADQMLETGLDELGEDPAGQLCHMILGNLAHASAGAESALNAVKGKPCRFFYIALFQGGNIVHDLDLHGAGLGAEVTGDAAEDFRIEGLNAFGGGVHFFYIVARPVGREEGDLGQIHIGLDHGLAGKAEVEFVVARHPVDGGTGPADAAAATGAAQELEAGKLHGLHDGQGLGYLVLFSHNEDGNSLGSLRQDGPITRSYFYLGLFCCCFTHMSISLVEKNVSGMSS